MSNYDTDTWYPAFPLTSANNTLRITEDPAGAPVTIDVVLDATNIAAGLAAPYNKARGRYYNHRDASFHTAGHRGLLYTIKELLNVGTTAGLGTRTASGAILNSYEVFAIDPTGSTGVLDGGLRIQATGLAPPATPFEITYTGGATTMDGRWFGQLDAAPVADPLSVTAALLENIDSPGVMHNRWIPYGIDGLVVASRKRPIPFKLARYSSERISDSEGTVWAKNQRLRLFEYLWLASAHLYANRGEDADFAAQAGLATGDANNVFERVWDSLTDGDEVLIVHDNTAGLQVDANSYEVLKFAGSAPDWGGLHSVLRDAGDYSRVAFTCFVSESNYNH